MFIVAINEQTSAVYTALLKDEVGAIVPGSSLSTLTLSVYSSYSGAIVNSRDHQNALNQNNVTLDENGLLTWLIQPGDTAILTDRLAIEPHIAEFKATWDSGQRCVTHRLELDVTNFATVP